MTRGPQHREMSGAPARSRPVHFVSPKWALGQNPALTRGCNIEGGRPAEGHSAEPETCKGLGQWPHRGSSQTRQ